MMRLLAVLCFVVMVSLTSTEVQSAGLDCPPDSCYEGDGPWGYCHAQAAAACPAPCWYDLLNAYCVYENEERTACVYLGPGCYCGISCYYNCYC
jgi:hypothetical protein